jgi:hypothetical protein
MVLQQLSILQPVVQVLLTPQQQHNLVQQDHPVLHVHMPTRKPRVVTVVVSVCVVLQTKFVATTLLFTRVHQLTVLVAIQQLVRGTLVTELVNS